MMHFWRKQYLHAKNMRYKKRLILIGVLLLIIFSLWWSFPTSQGPNAVRKEEKKEGKPKNSGDKKVQPGNGKEPDLKELTLLREALQAYATVHHLTVPTGDAVNGTPLNSNTRKGIPSTPVDADSLPESVRGRVLQMKEELDRYKTQFGLSSEGDGGTASPPLVTPEDLLEYHYRLPRQHALTGYHSGLGKKINPNLFSAIDKEEEEEVGELARLNAEAEKEYKDTTSRYTTHSRLFWEPGAITRRGYGLESSIFLVALPDRMEMLTLGTRDQSPTEVVNRVRSSMTRCSQSVRSAYRHARWPIALRTGVLELELYRPVSKSVPEKDFVLKNASERYYDATNSAQFVFEESFVFSCVPGEFVSNEQEERLSFSFKDNIRTKPLLFPLPSSNDTESAPLAEGLDRRIRRRKTFSPFQEEAYYRAYNSSRYSSKPALLYALLTLYRGETYVMVLGAGVVLTPSWDWRLRVQYTHTLTPHQAVLSAPPKTLTPRELVRVVMAVVRDMHLYDLTPAGKAALEKDKASRNPRLRLQGHINSNYYAAVHMAVPLWAHEELDSGAHFSPQEVAQYQSETSEGFFFAQLFPITQKEKSTALPPPFTMDLRHTLSAEEALHFLMGSNLSTNENDEISFDREYALLLQKSCQSFVGLGKNDIRKDLYERCWFYRHQTALQQKFRSFLDRNRFPLEGRGEEEASSDDKIPVSRCQQGHCEEGLVKLPLFCPERNTNNKNNNSSSSSGGKKRTHSVLQCTNYSSPRSLEDTPTDRQRRAALVVDRNSLTPLSTPSGEEGERVTLRAAPIPNGDVNTSSLLQSVVDTDFIFTVAETFFDIPPPQQTRIVLQGGNENASDTDSLFRFPPAVPLDPSLQIIDDTSSDFNVYLSARLFTSGWNLYAPTETIAYRFQLQDTLTRYYNKANEWEKRKANRTSSTTTTLSPAEKKKEEETAAHWKETQSRLESMQQETRQRFLKSLKKTDGVYSIGRRRSLEEYWNLLGYYGKPWLE